jgi:diguanylate cyclase (GGDEF)-like protein
MSSSLKDLFRWHFKLPDRSGRIDRVLATLTDPELEQQFRDWHWNDRRRTGLSILLLVALGVTTYIVADLAAHGWTHATMISTLARGSIVLAACTWVALSLLNRPAAEIDIATFALAASIGVCLTVEYVVRGTSWEDLAMPALTSVVMFTLFLRQPFKFTILGLAAQLLPFTVALFFTERVWSQFSDLALLYFGCGLGIYFVRQIAIVSRDHFLQNRQLETLASEMDNNMKTMAFEHETVHRAAEENAALADELALSRMAAEENAYYLENVLENIAQGVVVLDKDLRVTKFNSAYKRLAGVPDHLAKPGTHIRDICIDALERGLYVDEKTVATIKRAIATPDGFFIEGPVVIERPQGNGRYLEIRRNPSPDGGEVSTYTDITERRRVDEIIRAQALKDPLTDLSNRHHYAERLDDAIARSKRTGTYVALALLDLDLFKPVNDTHGHAVGDAVLRTVAATLRAHVREVDTVARLGGDEFAIVFDGIKSIADLKQPVDRILQALEAPQRIGDLAIGIGVSMGVAFFPLDADSAEGLAKIADRALYEAKESGRGRCKLSRPQYETGLPRIGKAVAGAAVPCAGTRR